MITTTIDEIKQIFEKKELAEKRDLDRKQFLSENRADSILEIKSALLKAAEFLESKMPVTYDNKEAHFTLSSNNGSGKECKYTIVFTQLGLTVSRQTQRVSGDSSQYDVECVDSGNDFIIQWRESGETAEPFSAEGLANTLVIKWLSEQSIV